MNWYLLALKKYAVFNGRARRKEYWYTALINLIIIFVLDGIKIAIYGSSREGLNPVNIITMIYFISVFIPLIAVTVRRFHDTGRTGWWLLIGFIPIVGYVVFLIFMILKGDPEKNRYGSSPMVGTQLSSKNY